MKQLPVTFAHLLTSEQDLEEKEIRLRSTLVEHTAGVYSVTHLEQVRDPPRAETSFLTSDSLSACLSSGIFLPQVDGSVSSPSTGDPGKMVLDLSFPQAV